MLADPAFHEAISRNLARRTAFCVREGDAGPGVPLLGALLFSPSAGGGEIGWLVVAPHARRRGIGRRLVEHVVGLVPVPGEVTATSFGGENLDGPSARAFFERLGFRAAEHAPRGLEGGSREVFRLKVG